MMKPTKEEFDTLVREELKGKIIHLLKFTSTQSYCEDVLNGNLYMNTAKYYREFEEQNSKGLGDLNELKLELLPENLTISINGETIGIKPQKCTFKYNEDEDRPIYCMTYLTIDDFEIYEYNEDNATFKLNLNLDKLSKDFGEYVTVINFEEFKNKVLNKCKENGINGMCRSVIYTDKNNEDRVNSFLNMDTDRFFYKDKFFEYQKEFRFVISNYVDNDKFFRVGSLKDIATNYETSELKNLIIEISNIEYEYVES